MSRIGRLPVKIPAGVTVTFDKGVLSVKGPLGALKQEINSLISVKIENGEIEFTRANDAKPTKALHGTYRAIANNMVVGVSQGFAKSLIIAGVGYKAVKDGKKVTLTLGYSHTIDVVEPEGITFEVPSATELVVKGYDKVAVGQCAASIRALREVEPYHGYGLHYKDEEVIRKVGKASGK